METIFKTIASYYLEEDYADRTDPELIAFTEDRVHENAENWTALRNIELGPCVIADLACLPPTIPATTIDEFRRFVLH